MRRMTVIAGVVVGMMVALTSAGLLRAAHPIAERASERRVYVSIVDKDGAPVTGMRAEELEVKVGGKTQPITSVQVATEPLRIALIVSDAGSGGFQYGIGRFLQKMLGHASFAFTSVMVQPELVMDYSDSLQKINPALARLGPRGRAPGGGQLLEAILDATNTVGTESERPVIIVMRVGAEGPSDVDARNALASLERSRAQLYVVSTANASRRPAPTDTSSMDSMARARAQFQDADVQDGMLNLDIVLGDGSRDSGGRHTEVVVNTMVKAMEGLADELLHQYTVTFAVPDSLTPAEKLSVSSKRKNVVVRAPARLR